MHLRALHPDRDKRLYRQAWQWKRAYPKRVRAWDGLKHFRHWWRLMQRRVTIGVFDNDLLALVTFQPCGNGVYEVHVDCPRNADSEMLIIALLNLRRIVFEQWGAREVFAGVISRNYGIIRIAEECGCRRDGVEYHTERLRWVRLRITDVEYQNGYKFRNVHEHVHANAGSVVAGY